MHVRVVTWAGASREQGGTRGGRGTLLGVGIRRTVELDLEISVAHEVAAWLVVCYSFIGCVCFSFSLSSCFPCDIWLFSPSSRVQPLCYRS